jgi:hypothetical protein
MRRTVTVTHMRDTDGSAIVKISLINQDDKEAILDEEDLLLLMSLGVSPCWLLTSNLVLARGKISVARLIVDAKAREKIKYVDGNSCNLRRSNLFITVGGSAKFDARSALNKRPKVVQEKINIKHVQQRPSWEIADSARANA